MQSEHNEQMEHNEQTEPMSDSQKNYEYMLSRSKKLKKRILIILTCGAAAVLLLFGSIRLVEYLTFLRDTTVPEGTYDFYPVYSGDIMEYRDYIQLNRQVSYCDDPAGYGATIAITEENKEDFEPPVLFMKDFVQTIIMGDAVGYNACFNKAYFKKVDPVEDFAQQMLYNITVTFYSTEKQDDGSVLTSYKLEYMIYENNGTYRRDIGSDMSRPQLVTLRIEKDGTIAIEKLITIFIK